MKSDLNLSRGFGLGGVTFSGSESALDGVVGLRGEARFNDDWSFSYYLDAGAGDSSFTGQTILAANYTYKSVEFALGYRYAYWDLKDFGPFDTMTLHGPLGYGSSSSAGAAPVQCGLRTMAGARGAAFAGVLNLAACSASTPDIVASSVPPPTPAQRVFVASSRAPSGDAAVFGRVRSTALTWARFDVSVPPDRKPGQVTMPLSKPPDPLTEFLISDAATYPSRNAFAASVERALLASGGPEWSIVIYVHGFNHSFADGLFRHAQIMVDFDSPSISVGYTWPSAGVSELYLYDRDSAFLPAPVWRS